MGETRPTPKFKIGDVLKDFKYHEGPYTVTGVQWKNVQECWGYEVAEDKGKCLSETILRLLYNGPCRDCEADCKGDRKCELFRKRGKHGTI